MSTATRKAYLAAMGLESWVLRTPPSVRATADAEGAHPSAQRTQSHGVPATPAPPAITAASQSLVAPAVSISEPRSAKAPLSGVNVPGPLPSNARAPTAVSTSADRESAFDWVQLRQRVAACTRCGLAATRTQTVFGVGNESADWLVVGEAPGAEEDRRGEPFVGRAGQLLNSMLHAIGLAREQVYIANMLKCRPPHNRDPAVGEVAECSPYLERQVALLRPKIMLVVGRIAAQSLLRTTVPLGRLRQQVHTYGASAVPVVVTYHPAYLLRTPADKRKAWDDLKFAREVSTRG